jgi:hypothetical protein
MVAHKITSPASLEEYPSFEARSKNFLSIYTSLIARRVFGKDILRFFDFPDKGTPF